MPEPLRTAAESFSDVFGGARGPLGCEHRTVLQKLYDELSDADLDRLLGLDWEPLSTGMSAGTRQLVSMLERGCAHRRYLDDLDGQQALDLYWRGAANRAELGPRLCRLLSEIRDEHERLAEVELARAGGMDFAMFSLAGNVAVTFLAKHLLALPVEERRDAYEQGMNRIEREHSEVWDTDVRESLHAYFAANGVPDFPF